MGCELSGKCCKTVKSPSTVYWGVPPPWSCGDTGSVTQCPCAGTGTSALWYSQATSFWFPQCTDTEVGAFPQIPHIPSALCSPGRSPRTKAGKCSCAQGLPVNIQPFAPIYCGSTNIGFIFSKPCPVFQCSWKIKRVNCHKQPLNAVLLAQLTCHSKAEGRKMEK